MTNLSLNWADIFIIGVILASTLISLMRGFISEALSLLTWAIAAIVAFKSATFISQLLVKFIHTPSVRLIVSFMVVLITILVIGSLLNHFLGVFIRSSGLSGTNRLLGMVFGFTRGVLLIAILILFAQTTSIVRDDWWQGSTLIPTFRGIVAWLHQFLPHHFQHFSYYLSKPHTGNS